MLGSSSHFWIWTSMLNHFWVNIKTRVVVNFNTYWFTVMSNWSQCPYEHANIFWFNNSRNACLAEIFVIFKVFLLFASECVCCFFFQKNKRSMGNVWNSTYNMLTSDLRYVSPLKFWPKCDINYTRKQSENVDSHMKKKNMPDSNIAKFIWTNSKRCFNW